MIVDEVNGDQASQNSKVLGSPAKDRSADEIVQLPNLKKNFSVTTVFRNLHPILEVK